MDTTLMRADGSTSNTFDVELISSLRDAKEAFWLDLVNLDEKGIDLLTNTFKFHPLAIDDAEQFGQRPKLEDYDGFVFLVGHGVSSSSDVIEVHFFFTGAYLVTVRRDASEVIDAAREHIAQRRQSDHANPVMTMHRILDALIDSYFPVLEAFDDRIDALEDEILENPTDEQLGSLFAMKRSLVTLRKVVTPERDMIASLLSGAADLPGMTPEAERYYRDLYDHLIRISDLVDSYRDLMSSAMDTHLSTVSNRLNEVMKQLTVIATVFLPLSFITGFFGQNFGWLVNRIGSLGAFIGLGLGLEVLSVVTLFVYFRRRRFL